MWRPWKLGTRARLLLRGLRYAPLLPYASIEGWLSIDEAIALYELARGLGGARPVVVEIGSWQGKSSVVLGKGLQARGGGVLHCIDPFDATATDASAGEYAERAAGFRAPLRDRFLANVGDAGVRDLVTMHQGFSQDVARTFDTPIDLLFLDGDHAFDAVARDYHDWTPRLRTGGWLAMHDVVHPTHDGPRRVVDEIVARDPRWTGARTVDSLWIARKGGGATAAPAAAGGWAP